MIKFNCLVIVGFCILSCTGLDDFKPIDAVAADNAINDLMSAKAALIGVYDAFQSIEPVEFQAQVYADAATSNFRYERFDQLNPASGAHFKDFYKVINTANNLIEAIPQINDLQLTNEIANNLMGQTLFLRALSYFYLTNYFRDIPLVTSPTREIGASLNVPNNEQSEIYSQIVNDLSFAKSNITESENSFATANAAAGLLARINLYLGNWKEAFEQAKDALGGDNFDLTETEYLQDLIFYLEYTSDDGNSLSWRYGPNSLGNRHSIWPTDKFIESIEENDKRRAKIIDDSFEYSDLPIVAKYDDYGGFIFFGEDPVMLIRHAEMVLIAAEAAAELGEFTNANHYFNQVRLRAGLPELILDQNNFVELILQERFIELSFEGPHRWFDLRRREKAVEHIDGYLPCHDVWPFPQSEVDNNPNLDQNDCCGC